MKAARLHQFKNPEQIKIDEIDVPKIQDNEVLIAVHAAGVNPIDWKIRDGYYDAEKFYQLPMPMGWDFSGSIIAKGASVLRFNKGDDVFGMIKFPMAAGTFAEYVVASADEITFKPKRCNHVQAGALPLVALTAWQGLFDLADLKAKQRVLIQGASGGVGQIAVQLAKWKGAEVIATGSSNAKELVLSLGASQFIDYKNKRFEEAVKDLDVVFDIVGEDTAIRAASTLKVGGHLVTVTRGVEETLKAKKPNLNIKVSSLLVKPNAKQLEMIAHLVDDGFIKINVAAEYPLSDVKAALDKVHQSHNLGKVVIRMK